MIRFALLFPHPKPILARRPWIARLPYAITALADGTVLPDCARQLIRSDIDWTQSLPDFRSVDGARFLTPYALVRALRAGGSCSSTGVTRRPCCRSSASRRCAGACSARRTARPSS